MRRTKRDREAERGRAGAVREEMSAETHRSGGLRPMCDSPPRSASTSLSPASAAPCDEALLGSSVGAGSCVFIFLGGRRRSSRLPSAPGASDGSRGPSVASCLAGAAGSGRR